jgi:hypothetical protein
MSNEPNKQEEKPNYYIDMWKHECSAKDKALAKLRKLERIVERAKQAMSRASLQLGCGCLEPNMCRACREANDYCDAVPQEI